MTARIAPSPAPASGSAASRTPHSLDTEVSLPQAEAVVDLAAITTNTRILVAAAGGAALMAVVKADGYGHGGPQAAGAALKGGAVMLGVATPPEAVALRDAGVTAPLVAWLWAPTADIRPAVAAGVQIGVSSAAQLARVIGAAPAAPGSADTAAGQVPIHLKVDTGMGRNGVLPGELPALLGAIASAERAKTVRLVGVMSHLACADVPGDPSVAAQIAAFAAATEAVRNMGLTPRWRHLANTAATFAHPAARFDMVRCGIGLYGLSPLADRFGLTPAMTLRASVALTKRVGPGQGVGYGLAYHTSAETTLALIPLGYGDGIPRAAGNRGPVFVAGRRRVIAGRVSMDQIVVDCGNDPVRAGDEAILFGAGAGAGAGAGPGAGARAGAGPGAGARPGALGELNADGQPTADDWAVACDTINYEIVTRIAPRVPRRYIESDTPPLGPAGA